MEQRKTACVSCVRWFDEELTNSYCSRETRGGVRQTYMDNPSWYIGCAFKHDEANGVVKLTQTAYVETSVGRFDIQLEAETPASITYDFGPKILVTKAIDSNSRLTVVCWGSSR